MKYNIVIAVFAGVTLFAISAAVCAIRGWRAEEQFRKESISHRAQIEDLRANISTLRESKKKIEKYIIKINAGISDMDSQRIIAQKITRHLYQATLFDSAPWAGNEPMPQLYMMTLNHEIANMCATLASIEEWALSLFDIPARSVNIASKGFLDGVDLPATHTFVEVLVDRHLATMDPTFSVEYTCGSGPVSAREMRDCTLSRNMVPIRLSETKPGRALEEYIYPIRDLAYAMNADRDAETFYVFNTPSPHWLHDARKLY